MPEDNAKVFNFAQLQEMTGGDEEFERELLEEYLSDTPNTFARLLHAIEEKEISGVHLESHSLKGSSQSLGADRLGSVAARLESLCHDGRLDGAEELYRDLEIEFGKVCQVVRDWLQRAA